VKNINGRRFDPQQARAQREQANKDCEKQLCVNHLDTHLNSPRQILPSEDRELNMTTAIDLFAGLGGWSTGARNAGIDVIWAANHWPVAVEWHSANHPDAIHILPRPAPGGLVEGSSARHHARLALLPGTFESPGQAVGERSA
jgi:hypothetical protein